MRLKGIAMSLLSVCVLTPATTFAETLATDTPDKEQVQTGICVLTGKIIDSETGEGIPMATINVPGTLIGTVCDADGRFRLELIEGKSYNLLVRSTGYMEQRIKIDANGAAKQMNIQMNAGIFDLNEVVVTGTRTEKLIKTLPY